MTLSDSMGNHEMGNLPLLLQNSEVVPIYRLFCCIFHLEDYVDLYVDILDYSNTVSISLDVNKQQKLAKGLFDKYFSAISLKRTENIEKKMIEDAACNLEINNIDANTFSPIQNFTLQFLKEKTYSAFLESPAYLNFLRLNFSINSFQFILI